MNSKVITATNSGELCIRNPFDETHMIGGDNAPEEVIDICRAKVAAIANSDQMLKDGGPAFVSDDAIMAVIKAARDADEVLKDYPADMERDLLERFYAKAPGYKAMKVQIKGAKTRIDKLSFRGKLREIAEYWERELDGRHPAPVHSYVVRLTCTDKALDAVIKAAGKAGATEVLAATAQSDKAVKQIAKWFEENV